MGFPSPADDYAQARLEVIDYIVAHPAATFFLRAETSCMARAGTRSGDVLVVDKSLVPQNGSIVVACVHGDFHVRQLRVSDGKHSLIATDSSSKPIEIDGEDCAVWGVVTFSIHSTHASQQ